MHALKKTKDKRSWYHCTTYNHGDKVTFDPQDDGINRGDGEPMIARTCVGPRISNCLAALPYIRNAEIYVYRTARRIFAHHPFQVMDSKVTREKWIIKQVRLVKIDNRFSQWSWQRDRM